MPSLTLRFVSEVCMLTFVLQDPCLRTGAAGAPSIKELGERGKGEAEGGRESSKGKALLIFEKEHAQPAGLQASQQTSKQAILNA